MKNIFLTILLLAGLAQVAPVHATASAKNESETLKSKMMTPDGTLSASFENMTADEFLTLTPKKVKEITGKKMSLKEKVGLKMAQKAVKKQMKGGASSIDKTVYIILAILIPFLAVGLATNWSGNDWWICLLLMFLFWIPGVIFAFIKMGDYY